MSHPTWVRGLKLGVRGLHRAGEIVAPYVGAWIETYTLLYKSIAPVVAPYVGAWIETKNTCAASSKEGSVAPYVGAWIETPLNVTCRPRKSVAPYVGAWIETSILTA